MADSVSAGDGKDLLLWERRVRIRLRTITL